MHKESLNTILNGEQIADFEQLITDWAQRIAPNVTVKLAEGQYLLRAAVFFEPIYAFAEDFRRQSVPPGFLLERTDWLLHEGLLLVSHATLVRPK